MVKVDLNSVLTPEVIVSLKRVHFYYFPSSFYFIVLKMFILNFTVTQSFLEANIKDQFSSQLTSLKNKYERKHFLNI